MRRRRRVAAEADHSPDPEPLRQRDDGVAERTPVVIGLRAVENEDIVAGRVAAGNERDLRPVEPDVHPFDDVHRWAASTVVEEPFRLELGNGHRGDLPEDGLGRLARAQTGVDPAREVDQQHRILQGR